MLISTLPQSQIGICCEFKLIHERVTMVVKLVHCSLPRAVLIMIVSRAEFTPDIIVYSVATRAT